MSIKEKISDFQNALILALPDLNDDVSVMLTRSLRELGDALKERPAEEPGGMHVWPGLRAYIVSRPESLDAMQAMKRLDQKAALAAADKIVDDLRYGRRVQCNAEGVLEVLREHFTIYGEAFVGGTNVTAYNDQFGTAPPVKQDASPNLDLGGGVPKL